MAMPEPQLLRLTWTDPVSGRQGFLVIDRLVRGVAGGGTRIRAGLDLEEVARLARAMSFKNGALGVAAGGAKCGIDCDPHDPDAIPMLTRFVRAMYPIFDTYMSTGEDMGVSQETINAVFAEVGLEASLRPSLRVNADPAAALERARRGLSLDVEGTPLVDLVGGFGVAEAAAAALDHLGLPVAGARVAVQGFGSMGGSTARYLAAKGARVVAVADANGLISNPAGLDVEALLRARNRFGEVDRSALRPGDAEGDREDWLATECEVLVPAAVADAIHATNVERIRARVVVEAANIPTTPEADAWLQEHGVTVIPDFVANSGTNGWAWWLALGQVDDTPEAAFARISSAMADTVARLLERAAAESISTREAARRIAIETLDGLAEKYGTEGPLLLKPL